MTAVLADPLTKVHDTGAGHLERAARFDAALRGLSAWPVLPSSRDAVEDELLLCHDGVYLANVRHDVESGETELHSGDTQISSRSLDAALRAVGTVLNAVDLVAEGKAKNAFCVVRPPGHHASASRGMGFCIYNNIAIGARYAQRKYGISRVLIADWDVHHGNGTQDIFYDDPSVFFFSTHQSPWYPGTGAAHEAGRGDAEGTTINCPFPAGSGRDRILGAFERRLIPAMEFFQPELVMISAGFDSRIDDPLGSFLLTDQDFSDLTGLLMHIADKSAGGRIVSVLEGGYSLSGLENAVRAHGAALRGE